MDRGNKLWEGHRLLLPQHRDLILEEKQKAKEYHPPELAADELEALDRTIRWSRAKKKADCTYLRQQVRSEAVHRGRPEHQSPRRMDHSSERGRKTVDSPVQNRRSRSGIWLGMTGAGVPAADPGIPLFPAGLI